MPHVATPTCRQSAGRTSAILTGSEISMITCVAGWSHRISDGSFCPSVSGQKQAVDRTLPVTRLNTIEVIASHVAEPVFERFFTWDIETLEKFATIGGVAHFTPNVRFDKREVKPHSPKVALQQRNSKAVSQFAQAVQFPAKACLGLLEIEGAPQSFLYPGPPALSCFCCRQKCQQRNRLLAGYFQTLPIGRSQAEGTQKGKAIARRWMRQLDDVTAMAFDELTIVDESFKLLPSN